MPGGILEAFGRLFTKNLKVYVYPALAINKEELRTSRNMNLSSDIKHIYNFLVENRKIIDIKNIKKEWLNIYSHEVLRKISSGDDSWEKMVPKYVANKIKSKNLFKCISDK